MIVPTLMVIVILVILGMIFGSFANALVWRLHGQAELHDKLDELHGHGQTSDGKAKKGANGKNKGNISHPDASVAVKELQAELETLSMAKGRSMCSNCRHPLAPKDLIPLLSWLSLGGKCRYCRQPIQDPPLLEAGLPLLFVASYWWWPLSLQSHYGVLALGIWLVILVGFVALALYDFRWYLLPNKVVWPLALLAMAQVILHATLFGGGWPVLMEAFWGVLICSGIFYLLYTVSKGEWIGGGDVKLGIILGLLVGGPLAGLLLIFTASLLGTLASLPALIQKQLKRTSIIPFGPFLMAACFLVLLFGQRAADWLNNLLALGI